MANSDISKERIRNEFGKVIELNFNYIPAMSPLQNYPDIAFDEGFSHASSNQKRSETEN